jgi:pantoate--beta-alanine ligase
LPKKLKLIYHITALRAALEEVKKDCSIGFVPTMGALHAGHLSLIEKSKQDNSLTICSIFVNQKQFNNLSDFEKYPVTIEHDLFLLAEIGCDIVFMPTHQEVYPLDDVEKFYDLGAIESVLEGRYRPGHFQGVCMVVHKLLEMVRPTILYLGKKDYQQCKVIQKMMTLEGLDEKIQVSLVATKRATNGLALSSRNLRLSEQALSKASILYQCLKETKEKIVASSDCHFELLASEAKNKMIENGFDSVDYYSFVNDAFEPIDKASTPNQSIVILTAATIEGVRLIDNIII